MLKIATKREKVVINVTGEYRRMCADMQSQNDDLEIIRRVINGESQLFSMIHEKYVKIVYMHALSGLRNKQLAEETTQNVFLRVYRNLSKYDGSRGSFSTYLYEIVKSEIHTTFRNEKRSSFFRRERNNNNNIKDITNNNNTEDSIDGRTILDNKILNNQQSKYLYDCLLKLNDNEKEVLIEFYFKELGVNDIANNKNMPIGTVKSCLSRGRDKLGEMLKMIVSLI